MTYKHAHYNTTKIVPEKKGLGSAVTGKADAVVLRNRYQKELDNAHASIVNMVHYIEDKNSELKSLASRVEGLRKDLQAHEEEKSSLFVELENLLKNEKNTEKEMWLTTLKHLKPKSIVLKQKFKDTDIEELRTGSVMDFFRQYPEFMTKGTYKDIRDQAKKKEDEIRRQKQEYNDVVSKYNFVLSDFKKNIMKAEDKFAVYDKILAEGTNKLKENRYVKSVLFKLASEKTKLEVTIDTLQHRVEQFRNTLNLIKSEHSLTKEKKFTEMEY